MTTSPGCSPSPPALLLVGLGAVTLWRSRRRDRACSADVIGRARCPSRWRLRGVLRRAAGAVRLCRHSRSACRTCPPTQLGVAHENVSFTTSDGLRCRAGTSRRATAPRSSTSRAGSAPRRPRGCSPRHGYGVLLFDRRGEGRSEGGGEHARLGRRQGHHRRCRLAEEAAGRRPRRIGGIGFSVGGELLLEAAAKDPDLAAVVSDGAGARQLLEVKKALPGRDSGR